MRGPFSGIPVIKITMYRGLFWGAQVIGTLGDETRLQGVRLQEGSIAAIIT